MPSDVLVLLDLDHTLLPNDTDEGWVDFLLQRGLLDRPSYEAANRDLAARYALGEAGPLEFTEFYLSALKPFEAVELERFRAEFMQSRIVPSIPKAARDLVESHRSRGAWLVMTTATSRFLSAPIAAELRIGDMIATEAEIRDGRYTGRVAGTPNMREGKVERLHAWLAERDLSLSAFRESWFFSDSHNDLPLLSRVTHPVAVNADPVLAAHARQHGWPQIVVA